MDLEHPSDDSFGASDLDELPENAFHDLERNALLSTQQTLAAASNSAQYTDKAHQRTNSSKVDIVHGDPFDYDFHDQDVVDLNARPGYSKPHVPIPPVDRHEARRSSQRIATDSEEHQERGALRQVTTGFRANGATSKGHVSIVPDRSNLRPVVQAHSVQSPLPTDTRLGTSQSHNPANFGIATLQARIQELEHERLSLRKEVEDAKTVAMSKAGEIAIVRANHEKSAREYERRMNVLQKLHEEEVAKQRAEADVARREREKVETNNKFLEHEIAQETKHRNVKKPLRDNASPFTTPKKTTLRPLGDGFDDDEVMAVTPLKLKEQRKTMTPKAGNKRKRPIIEKSPVAPLPLSEAEPVVVMDVEMGETHPSLTIRDESILIGSEHKERLEFMQSVLNHRSYAGGLRILEDFGQFYLPSSESESLASKINDEMSRCFLQSSMIQCRIDFCSALLSLWSQCLDDKYYKPLCGLQELVSYILLISASNLSTYLVPQLVPLCSKTADIVAFLIIKAARNPSVDPPPSDELRTFIDPYDYVNLLFSISLTCTMKRESLIAFWTAMDFDFVLVLLHKAQPLHQILLMLQLLRTSIIPTSFGTITNSPQQAKNEASMVDRLTVLLFDQPSTPGGDCSAEEIFELRSSVLGLLKSLCLTEHGGNALATHPLAISRLVRFLHGSILTLYSHEPSTHVLTTHLVNETVLLLAHLTSCHSDVVDMRSRLAVMPGGTHKHLVSLSRVAFADGLSVIERGIKAEVAEAAHKMLDEHLSPEEGEAVLSVFSSARS